MKKDKRKFPDFSDMFWIAFLQTHGLLASPSEKFVTTQIRVISNELAQTRLKIPALAFHTVL